MLNGKTEMLATLLCRFLHISIQDALIIINDTLPKLLDMLYISHVSISM